MSRVLLGAVAAVMLLSGCHTHRMVAESVVDIAVDSLITRTTSVTRKELVERWIESRHWALIDSPEVVMTTDTCGRRTYSLRARRLSYAATTTSVANSMAESCNADSVGRQLTKRYIAKHRKTEAPQQRWPYYLTVGLALLTMSYLWHGRKK